MQKSYFYPHYKKYGNVLLTISLDILASGLL